MLTLIRELMKTFSRIVHCSGKLVFKNSFFDKLFAQLLTVDGQSGERVAGRLEVVWHLLRHSLHAGVGKLDQHHPALTAHGLQVAGGHKSLAEHRQSAEIDRHQPSPDCAPSLGILRSRWRDWGEAPGCRGQCRPP